MLLVLVGALFEPRSDPVREPAAAGVEIEDDAAGAAERADVAQRRISRARRCLPRKDRRSRG
jgi:hypothetical protein